MWLVLHVLFSIYNVREPKARVCMSDTTWLVVCLDENQWRSAHYVGLVQKLSAPDSWGRHQPRPIAQKIRKRKKCRLRINGKMQLIMLNNKASIGNGN